MPVKSVPTPEATEAEAPTVIDRIEAATTTEALASLMSQSLTATEAEHLVGRMLVLDTASVSQGVEAGAARYVNIGTALVGTARIRINSGLAVNTKGAKRDPIPVGTSLTFADVKDALGVRESGDKWTPNVPGARPVGRTECQRYWEASALTTDAILAARALVKPDQVNNTRILVETAAATAKRDRMTATARAEAEVKDAARATAKADREAAAKRAAALVEEATDGTSLLSTHDEATATLADLVATLAAVTAAIGVRQAAAEAKYQATANADAMLAALALARGVSIDEMRDALAALPAAS